MTFHILDVVQGSPMDPAAMREIHPQWNYRLVAASIAVSLIGAFTSTQLMCSARVATSILSMFVWILLGSFVFGFCGIWALHEVAMLACELDVLVGINASTTILSALLATVFTFIALGWGPFQERFREKRLRDRRSRMRRKRAERLEREEPTGEAEPLATTSIHDAYSDHTHLGSDVEGQSAEIDADAETQSNTGLLSSEPIYTDRNGHAEGEDLNNGNMSYVRRKIKDFVKKQTSTTTVQDLNKPAESPPALSRASSSDIESSTTTSFGLGHLLKPRQTQSNRTQSVLEATLIPLYAGLTPVNILKGFWWSLAITSMHYVGIRSLSVPHGRVILNTWIVLLSALISWTVCTVGCILMAHMETRLSQQLLFSCVATAGVAAMHFTGMRAATFVTSAPPSGTRGYPPELAIAVATVAIVTCLAANFLLAHSATVSRDKLAEIVMTRRKLWRTIAQKESAEAAAAARSDFIASASHEIRTPLHHLQGYSDLLSRTDLSDESRLLLQAIQGATKTLSSITNNVLDWSRIENDSEAAYRPVDLDIRVVCDSVMNLLPASDDDAEIELLVVVTPDVPKTLLLDEAYINRVLMNLLSNALKFTKYGYILLVLECPGGDLVVTVKDTGCGIPPNFLPHMFEPFKQAQTRSMSRGTGLGLSIVRQLLTKMHGSIDVSSNYEKDVPEGQNGSTFTISIPLSTSRNSDDDAPMSPVSLGNVAILENRRNSRANEGLALAWRKANHTPSILQSTNELACGGWKYISADIDLLMSDESLRTQLFEGQHTVLVPFNKQSELKQLPDIKLQPHVVPLQKPLRWHTFEARVATVKSRPPITPPPMKVRFAEEVPRDDNSRASSPTRTGTKRLTILLAEDNPINQRLARKMVASLGHDILVSEDGQDCIDKLKRHDADVDLILMDQSMPRKDGATATREIRELEKTGVLRRRHPIIALTAVVGVNAQAMCREAGMDDFLAKPMSLARLESTLSAFIPVNG